MPKTRKTGGFMTGGAAGCRRSPGVSPDFNDAMREKWIEILSDPLIPQPSRGGTSWVSWFAKANAAYNKWMVTELHKAEGEGINETEPPLYRVTFAKAKVWGVKMLGAD